MLKITNNSKAKELLLQAIELVEISNDLKDPNENLGIFYHHLGNIALSEGNSDERDLMLRKAAHHYRESSEPINQWFIDNGY